MKIQEDSKILAIFARPIMKKLFYTIILALAAAAAVYSALTISVAEMPDFTESGISSDTGRKGCVNILKDSDLEGLFAYNALKGTAEHLNASDNRQVLVFRNTGTGVPGYNQASSKRQHSPSFKLQCEGGITHSFPEKYYFLQHNVNILDRGMSSNSERIHLLRILIV